MKKIIIIGSGINGLVAANYLVKEGYDVNIIEKKNITGGACIKDSIEINNKQGFYPKTPKLVYFQGDQNSTKIYQNYNQLQKELENNWGEKGRVNDFRNEDRKT